MALTPEQMTDLLKWKAHVVIDATVPLVGMESVARWAAAGGHVTVKGCANLRHRDLVRLAQLSQGHITFDFTA